MKLGLNIFIYMRDSKVPTKYGIDNLHPTKATHWICYIDMENFDRYGCPPPKVLTNFLVEKYRDCVFSEYTIEIVVSFCAVCYLYVFKLTENVKMTFISAVMHL